MNPTNPTNNPSNVPWPASDHRGRLNDTTTLPGSSRAEPAAMGLLNQATQGAHEGIDRLADSAAPAVRKLGEGVAAAEDALHEKADQLRQTRDAWTDDARTTVRRHPLASVAAAFALGVIFARITR